MVRTRLSSNVKITFVTANQNHNVAQIARNKITIRGEMPADGTLSHVVLVVDDKIDTGPTQRITNINGPCAELENVE